MKRISKVILLFLMVFSVFVEAGEGEKPRREGEWLCDGGLVGDAGLDLAAVGIREEEIDQDEFHRQKGLPLMLRDTPSYFAHLRLNEKRKGNLQGQQSCQEVLDILSNAIKDKKK